MVCFINKKHDSDVPLLPRRIFQLPAFLNGSYFVGKQRERYPSKQGLGLYTFTFLNISKNVNVHASEIFLKAAKFGILE